VVSLAPGLKRLGDRIFYLTLGLLLSGPGLNRAIHTSHRLQAATRSRPMALARPAPSVPERNQFTLDNSEQP